MRCAPNTKSAKRSPHRYAKAASEWHATQRLDEQTDGVVILHFQASGLGEVMLWVLQYGEHAEVLSPLTLRESVAESARSMATLYGVASL